MQAKAVIHTWESLNPDWMRYLLDDEDLMLFMSLHFDQTEVDTFHNLPLPVMKTDFFRLAVMYYEGGIYADVDVQCNQPIQKWDGGPIDKCDVIVGMEYNSDVCNWGFASRKGHPLFKWAIELSLLWFINTTIDFSSEHFVHGATGPHVFTLALKDIAKEVGCVIPDSNTTKDMHASDTNEAKD